MKWRGVRQSKNVEDRRRMGTKGRKAVLGGGAIGIIILLFQMFGGETAQQLTPVLEQLNQQGGKGQSEIRELTPKEVELGKFAGSVLTLTEEAWTQIFRENNLGVYEKPKMVLFTDYVSSACGGASAATGPFYCPADRKIYVDLSFFDQLRTKFGAKGGDFAMAYVIAHEVGHHVQTLLGISQKVRKAQQGKSKREKNRLSVAQELQADFYAGLWAHYKQTYLEEGDIEEALDAAHAVGDDAIQRRMQGQVVPDSFTHGTSKQRMKWFLKGFRTGDIHQHDTFSAEL